VEQGYASRGPGERDIGCFLDGGWAEKATVLGWGPLDLLGCDRERPFARIDYAGPSMAAQRR